MTRSSLLHRLHEYRESPWMTASEEPSWQEMVAFIQQYEDCFHRELLIGHLTASAWLVDASRKHCLLMHHKKLDRWMQTGGHADGCENLEVVARKELKEESGLDIPLEQKGILFDVDVHSIPAWHSVPAHKHYDVRFLWFLPHCSQPQANEESYAVRWVPLAEIHHYTAEASLLRMAEKAAHFSFQ